MARARNIKPQFFTNDQLAEIHPLGRLLFIALWTMADKAGRLEDRPKRIKAGALPYDNANVDRLLSDLQEHGFILRYEACGGRFIQILAFSKHQNPHMKEPESTIPAPYSHGADTGKSGASPGKSGAGSGNSGASPADSGFLIPDSPSLIPDAGDPVPAPDPPAEKPPARDSAETAGPEPATDPPTLAGKACVALRAAGVQAVNPSHPKLAELLASGVTPKQLGDLAIELAEAKGSPPTFAYLLATMAGRLRDAAGAAPARRPVNGRALPYPAEFVGWERDERKTTALCRHLGMGDGPPGASYDQVRQLIRTRLEQASRVAA